MNPIRSFRDLDAWALSMDLVDHVILQTRALPPDEFDLRRQIRRAAISIPANVAEGYRRKGRRRAYQNHVSIAMGSQGELDTQLEVACRHGFLKRDALIETIELCQRVGTILIRLHDSLE